MFKTYYSVNFSGPATVITIPLHCNRHYYFFPVLGFPDSSVGKESACNARDLSLIPGLGRSPGERNSYPLQYSGLENSMDCIVHVVAKSQIRPVDFHSPTRSKAFTKEPCSLQPGPALPNRVNQVVCLLPSWVPARSTHRPQATTLPC